MGIVVIRRFSAVITYVQNKMSGTYNNDYDLTKILRWTETVWRGWWCNCQAPDGRSSSSAWTPVHPRSDACRFWTSWTGGDQISRCPFAMLGSAWRCRPLPGLIDTWRSRVIHFVVVQLSSQRRRSRRRRDDIGLSALFHRVWIRHLLVSFRVRCLVGRQPI